MHRCLHNVQSMIVLMLRRLTNWIACRCLFAAIFGLVVIAILVGALVDPNARRR